MARNLVRAPRHTIPDQEMDPDTAYQFVRDELMLDGNARLNPSAARPGHAGRRSP